MQSSTPLKKSIVLLISLFSGLLLQAQRDSASAFISRGYDLYRKGDYCQALTWYEKGFAYKKVNYPLYQAAVSACQCGQPAKALGYFKEFLEHGGDFYNYEFFVSDTTASCFSTTPEWKNAMASFKRQFDSVELINKQYYASITDTSLRLNRSPLTDTAWWKKKAVKSTFPALRQSIQQYHQFARPPKTDHWTLYELRVNDTLTVPYLVYIPRNYQPGRPAPLYVFLHGGVSNRPGFASKGNIPAFEKEVFEQPRAQNAFIIYPFARKDIQWLSHRAAFDAISAEIAAMKSLYNIDDNKVSIAGHSDGGRGVFWFALNRPTPFAAFLGFNYYPALALGNTHLGNLKNHQPFYGISGLQDNLFIKDIVNAVYEYGRAAGANWRNWMIEGGHGIPYDTPAAVHFIYDSLQHQTRNPYPRQLQWQTDNVLNGRYYWIDITGLDTLTDAAAGHPVYNPIVPGKDNKMDTFNFNKRRSGFLQASIEKNVVRIHTSCIKELTFYAYPELIDLSKPIAFYINEKPAYSVRLQPDKEVILQDFLTNKDRRLLPAAKISIIL